MINETNEDWCMNERLIKSMKNWWNEWEIDEMNARLMK